MKITHFPGVVPDGEPPVPLAMREVVRESRRHGFDQHIRNLYDEYSPPDRTPDLDEFWTAALLLAYAAHHDNGLPWADAFDSVIQRISGRPDVERAGAISEIFIEQKLRESPGFARGSKALPNDDWHGAPDETLCSMAQSAVRRHESARQATYQDVLDAPAHLVAEIISGTLHTHPRPAMPHALASSNLGDELVSPFAKGRGGPGGWWIIDEPELHLAEDIVVPDLAGWRRERMPEYPDTAYVSVVPDWVCEVLSPSTRKVDLHEKRPVYAREGVAHLWLIDPTDRTLETFELHEGQWLLIGSAKDDDPVSIHPFDAITFSLGELWP